jgi:hypothetical protein
VSEVISRRVQIPQRCIKMTRWIGVVPLGSFSYSGLRQHFCFTVAVLCLTAVIKLARGSFWFLAEGAREWKDLHVQWFSSPVGDAAKDEGECYGHQPPYTRLHLGAARQVLESTYVCVWSLLRVKHSRHASQQSKPVRPCVYPQL